MFGRKKDGERSAGQTAPTPVSDEDLDALLMRSSSRKAAAPSARPAAAGVQEPTRRPAATPGVAAPAMPVAPAAPAVKAAPTPPTATSSEGRRLIVGRDICLKGEVTSCDTLIVEGSVDLSRTDARHIQVAAGGVFTGTIDVEEADIAGRFDGELMARDRLIVRSGGVVEGTIRYANIIIEAGGHIAGEVAHMDVAATRAAPAPSAAPSDAGTAEGPQTAAAWANSDAEHRESVGSEPSAEPMTPHKTAIERAAVPLPPRVARPLSGRE